MEMQIWHIVGIWVAAFYTLGIFSLTVKLNPWFKLVENTFVGFAVGYATVIALRSIVNIAVTPLMMGNMWRLIPIISGLLLFTRFVRPVARLSRWPIALLIGLGTGLGMRGAVQGMILQQIDAMFISPIVWGNPIQSFSNTTIIVMVLTVLFYFIFSKEHTGTSGKLAKVARLSMMIAFGASFGNTITYRTNLLTERLDFLIHQWLGI
jgi:hypothetical protein